MQSGFHWGSVLSENFPSTMYNPADRKLHPPTGWCRDLERSWKVNSIFTGWEQILCGNRCCWLLQLLKLPSEFSSWKLPFLEPTEIAKGLCWDYKKDELGQPVLPFFIVLIIREGLSPLLVRETRHEGYDYLHRSLKYGMLLIIKL